MELTEETGEPNAGRGRNRMVRKIVAAALALCMVLAAGGNQAVVAQAFDNIPGLQRAVIRAYLAPTDDSLEVTLVDINDQGTPIGEPEVVSRATATVATPELTTVSGVVLLSIGIFEFDSSASATGAFDRLSSFAEDVSSSEPVFRGGSRALLQGIGDQSFHATAVQNRDGLPFSYLFTVVRSDRYVYLLQGTLVRLDATAEARRMLSALIANPVGGAENHDPDGQSTGGLWDKYTGVDPVLIEGSLVYDTGVFPTEAGTPASSGSGGPLLHVSSLRFGQDVP